MFLSKYNNIFSYADMVASIIVGLFIIKTGFEVLKDNATEKEFVVFNTHLDHVSDEARINGIKVVLDKIAEFGSLPAVIMGDFNARYTRDDYETNFWNVLDADLRANLQDAWTELIWGGWYPDYGTPSWVVSDKYDPNNTVGDIEYGEQEGEVVDKILYINDPQSDVRIWAKSYKRDMNYDDLSDHNPVVVEFGYEKVK